MMEKYLEMLKNMGADFALTIDPHTVVTAPWTVYKCKFGCGSYGKNYCCPPNAPTYKETREILDCFSKGILFRTHRENTITPMAVKLARELFLDGYYKALAFGDGNCQKCAACSPEGCRFPGQSVPSMEACGIDVFATVCKYGLELRTLRVKGEPQNHFGLVLAE